MSGLADVTSPPYDVIFRDNEDQLIAADPHNVVRLILPRPVPGRPGEEYRDAAVLLREWLAQQILIIDPAPALYVYEQAAAGSGDRQAGQADGREDGRAELQRGLIGRLRLVPADAGIVLPHEDVSPGPVGRLALMEATQANLEPIFLLYDGATPGGMRGPGAGGGPGAGDGRWAGAAARIVAETAARPPLVEAETSDGRRHRLWAVTDEADLAAIAADLAPRRALIADGHHRYAAYLGLQERRRQAGDGAGPWDYGLALLVDSSSYPPHIGAIHRVIAGLEIQRAAKLAAGAFSVRSLPADLPGALAELAAASASGPAFVLAAEDRFYLLTSPDPAQAAAAMPGGYSGHWRALPAAVLQELLISRVWAVTDDERTVRAIHHDAGAALRAAKETAGTAVLCSPMSPADVYEVAAHGEKVPRKSTSFAPKPRTGLVLRTFAQG